MDNVINQRKEDINAIADIMTDIHQIAGDLAVEVKDGGEKLDQLNDNMGDADKKAEEALTEL
jgi:t-SNARE complex subunit (syntaxin)